jgi:hypothetical protein
MLVRIFGDAPDAAEWGVSGTWDAKLVQSLCQLAGRRAASAAPWTFEFCDPLTWGSRTSSADIHIYLTEPCRLAVPWATCNVALVSRAWWSAFGAAWLPWAATEIDLFVVRGEGEPVAGLPADRLFTLREAGAKSGSPLRAYAESWRRLMETAERRRHPPALPAALPRGAEIPRVAVITLTRNRPQWAAVAVRNVVGARWPLSRLEWIIVDDSDEGKGLESQVESLRASAAALTIRYVKLTPGSLSIGAKRNAGVAAAGADVNLFVCMDDDDYYPEDSIGRRVSWLAAAVGGGGRGAVYCATIPMYDTTRYISAMNAPPLILSAAQRVSEATLAFTREFWTARPFPEVSMAEGEGFLAGRETQTVEIPPYGVIVSFIHQGNTSSRRVPAEQPANGCHYGFSDEFFRLVHETALIK